MTGKLGTSPRSILQAAVADLASLPATSRWVHSGTVAIHALDYGGDLPPVVFLPGITSPAVTMDFVARELLDMVRPVILDVRGRGLSDSADSYSLQDYADDTVAVIRSLGLPSPILVGHSLGARIASLVAAQGVAELSGVVLVDPPMSSGPGRGPYPVKRQAMLDQLAAASRGTSTAEMALAWPNWPRREQALRARWLSSCDVEAVVASHAGFEADDFFASWREVPAPAVLMYGSESVMATERDVSAAKAVNGEARFVEVPGAGHMVFWDAPQTATAALRDAIQELTQSNPTGDGRQSDK